MQKSDPKDDMSSHHVELIGNQTIPNAATFDDAFIHLLAFSPWLSQLASLQPIARAMACLLVSITTSRNDNHNVGMLLRCSCQCLQHSEILCFDSFTWHQHWQTHGLHGAEINAHMREEHQMFPSPTSATIPQREQHQQEQHQKEHHQQEQNQQHQHQQEQH